MKQWKRDLYLSIGMFLVSAGNIVYGIALKDRVMKYTLARADTYLILWLGCLMLLSVLLFIRTLRNKPQGEAVPVFTKITVFTAIWLCVYVFLLRQIGFVLDTVLFLFVLFAVYTAIKEGVVKDKKKLAGKAALWLALSVAVTLAIYYSFTVALSANLPAGRLIDLAL